MGRDEGELRFQRGISNCVLRVWDMKGVRISLSLLFVFLGAGCACNSSKPVGHDGGLIHERNEGYSLIYALMTDESKVDQLLVIKSASDPVKKIVGEISAASKEARAQLDSYKTPESRIVFDEADLPKVEQESRDLESKREAKALLFSSGKPFEARLIFTQAQAMGYAANLCQALAAHEDDAGRKNYLTKLGGRFAGLRDRLMGMLDVKG